MHINAISRVTMREYEIAITILNRRDDNYCDFKRLVLIKVISRTYTRVTYTPACVIIYVIEFAILDREARYRDRDRSPSRLRKIVGFVRIDAQRIFQIPPQLQIKPEKRVTKGSRESSYQSGIMNIL